MPDDIEVAARRYEHLKGRIDEMAAEIPEDAQDPWTQASRSTLERLQSFIKGLERG